ncbi:helix-turn-helix transcriptional regulator [Humibacter antri]
MPLPLGYAEYPAPAPLAGIVDCVWTRTSDRDGERSTAGVALVLPDACTDLIWASGVGVVVAGPDTMANSTSFGESTVFVGVRFGPGFGGAAFGVPLSEIRNSRLDAADAWTVRSASSRSAFVRDALSAVESAGTSGDAMSAVLRFATAVAQDVSQRRISAHAARRMRNPGVTVGGLADELGVSRRHLQRLFTADVGYGPKTLQRIDRFQRFLVAHERSGSLADAAAITGFADQPHLTRECVSLTGMTPAALMELRAR